MHCVMDLRLFCNRTMCVVGPSHSGKTTFVIKLLDERHELFDCLPQRVVWCYGVYQHELHVDLQNRGFLLHRDIITESATIDFAKTRPHTYDVINLMLDAAILTARQIVIKYTADRKPHQ